MATDVREEPKHSALLVNLALIVACFDWCVCVHVFSLTGVDELTDLTYGGPPPPNDCHCVHR